MPDIIKLLPDSVANQIAAGEVVQRPASAVKELLENSIDAGATEIKLIIKDAGRSLIQVIDNGCGMSETDARMSFERHATSKISQANDLFRIRTLGFRGEALASIAAIAQVEMKTRRYEDELGTEILVEGSVVKSQQSCSCPAGTSIAVKNLFFNVPARRNFLKSNPIELRHILDEFYRVTLAYPNIAFTLFDNDIRKYSFEKSGLKPRIVQLFGSAFNEKLVPLEQKSDVVSISGFIGKPEFAKKNKGEQFFFVNNRFIKHSYLHHAVENAYKELVPESTHPPYFIFLSLDPSKIDVNIHPTKTEVNFLESQVIYSILRATVQKSLGIFNLRPALDFDVEKSFDYVPGKNRPVVMPGISINPDYNPFTNPKPSGTKVPFTSFASPKSEIPEQIPHIIHASPVLKSVIDEKELDSADDLAEQTSTALFQLQNRYIVTRVRSGMMIIDQQAAHERILFEKLLKAEQQKKPLCQRLLFPVTLELSPEDADVLRHILHDINQLGFEIDEFGQNSFIVHGTPLSESDLSIEGILDEIILHYKTGLLDVKMERRWLLIRAVARSLAIKAGKKLQLEEMQNIINELFTCSVPEQSPSGKSVVKIISMEEIAQKFK